MNSQRKLFGFATNAFKQIRPYIKLQLSTILIPKKKQPSNVLLLPVRCYLQSRSSISQNSKKSERLQINYAINFMKNIMSLKLLSSSKCFGGEQRVYSHFSEQLNCEMKLGVFMPQTAIENIECPVVIFLSGLTCTHENFIQKSGFQRCAANLEMIVVNPDTSPRNVNINGENDSYDFGSGAGFYIDATVEPWSSHYKMYSYLTKELKDLINANLPTKPNKYGICGHSMGGHGSLITILKNPGLFQSASVFAPIANPIACPWGQKAFTGYLGPDVEKWKQWDATCLVTNYSGTPIEIFIDQGTDDEFLKSNQLLPEHFLNAAAKNNDVQTIYKQRNGYDHSYFFISTFIGEHLEYHAKILKT